MTSRWKAIAGTALLTLCSCAHKQPVQTAAVEPAPQPAPPPPPAPAPAVAEAPPPAPAPPPPPPAADLPKLFQAGTTFIEETTAKDVTGRYFLTVDNLKKGLTWTWKASEDEAAPHGTIKTGEAVLKSASEISFISQNIVSPSGKKAKATPPFLLSRSEAKALRSGKTAKIRILDVKGAVLKADGTETKDVIVNGTNSSVSTIKATDGHTTLWFVDDLEWPVVVSVTFDGDHSMD